MAITLTLKITLVNWSLLGFVLIGGFIPWAWAAQRQDPPLPFTSPQQEAHFYQLATEFRCLQCQNQAITDSPAPIAAAIRRRIFGLLQQGWTDQQIRDYFVSRYGRSMLYRPPLNRQTAMLWMTPWLLVLIASSGMLLAISRARWQSVRQ